MATGKKYSFVLILEEDKLPLHHYFSMLLQEEDLRRGITLRLRFKKRTLSSSKDKWHPKEVCCIY